MIALKIKAGIIGMGFIGASHLEAIQRTGLGEVAAVADVNVDLARKKAEDYGIPKCYASLDELLADPEIEIVINLTIPVAHAEVNMAALEAGKNVHVEKPLAITREDGRKILEFAKSKGLLVGCAPDTFMGGGIQTCRKLIDDGWIGKPVAATAFMTCHGHESWHPDPEFYYKVGGGPMFDMGPYYLTALTSLIGPVRRVTGSARITFPERTITSQPKYGTKITVNVPTHVAGVMDFANGAVGTIIASFDVWPTELPRIEIYGTEGTLGVPDPNGFGGSVKLRRPRAKEWEDVALTHLEGNVAQRPERIDVGRRAVLSQAPEVADRRRRHRDEGVAHRIVAGGEASETVLLSKAVGLDDDVRGVHAWFCDSLRRRRRTGARFAGSTSRPTRRA
jgi:predicted dehydrogenase